VPPCAASAELWPYRSSALNAPTAWPKNCGSKSQAKELCGSSCFLEWNVVFATGRGRGCRRRGASGCESPSPGWLMRNSHPKVNIRTTLSEMVHSSDARHLPREAFNDPSLSCRRGAPRTAGEVREPRRGMILLSWADRWPGRTAAEAGDPYESLRAFADAPSRRASRNALRAGPQERSAHIVSKISRQAMPEDVKPPRGRLQRALSDSTGRWYGICCLRSRRRTQLRQRH